MKNLKKLMSIAVTTAVILGCGATLNAAPSGYNINDTFPDQALKKFVRQYDLNSDGYLDQDEISLAGVGTANSRSLIIDNPDMQSLEGLEIFTSCSTLALRNCNIKVVDLTTLPFTTFSMGNSSGVIAFVCGKAQKDVNLSGCENLKNLYFNYAYNLQSIGIFNCPSLSGNVYLDSCNLLKRFHSERSNIKKLGLSDEAKLDFILMVDCPVRFVGMAGTGLDTLRYLGIGTNGACKTGFTCKADLAMLLWNNELPDHMGYRYNEGGYMNNSSEIEVEIDYSAR